ncbi:ABC transporter permease subunit [Roseomonas aerophila]|uniref:ABC transporter permease subunit n=1 Tax=Teichococcus aerophilus TaxID=1224513 RepID=A0ABR7RK98_9PROT|nr:ABC transporter permease subunit [Pseudoroseomonas aerophila]MBC9207004.1 ABC transporter permease subunit [Pseudoroseomonas aerophila]
MSAWRWLPRILLLVLFAGFIFGPVANLLLWSVAESWYWPNRLPSQYGFRYWERVFRPEGQAMESLGLSIWIAALATLACMAVAIPAAWALARARLPMRGLILLLFLLPQAFPNMPVYINIARVFFSLGLNGTVLGVVLVHAAHGLVYAVWIAAAAFAAVEDDAVLAARNMGAGALTAFRTVTLPLAAPGIAASAIFVFLESLDEFTASFFVGAPDVRTLPLLLYSAAAGGNMQVAAITALILLVPSIVFMAVVQRFLRADVLAGVGK